MWVVRRRHHVADSSRGPRSVVAGADRERQSPAHVRHVRTGTQGLNRSRHGRGGHVPLPRFKLPDEARTRSLLSMSLRKSQFALVLVLVSFAGCNGGVSPSSRPRPSCAPNCGKADGVDSQSAAARLWDLPEHAWPAPLDVEPIFVSAEVVIEGAYAEMAEDPMLSAFEASQLAVAAAVGQPDIEVSDFGPLAESAVTTRSWGRLALPALVAAEIDGDHFNEGAIGLIPQSGQAGAIAEVIAASEDPIAYADISTALVDSDGVSPALAGRLLEFSRQVMLGEPRYTASGRMRTLEDVPDRPVAEVIQDMASSEVAQLRLSALRGAENLGLLTTEHIDDALADDDFRVRSAASAHFFESSETSESAQAAFLARLEDPAFVAAVRLDVIRSMGFSDLHEDRFADEPAGLAETLALYRGAVVGQMLQAAPSDRPLLPLFDLASKFAAVDPVGRELLRTLRRNTTLTADEKAAVVADLLWVEYVRDDACSFLFEQLYAEGEFSCDRIDLATLHVAARAQFGSGRSRPIRGRVLGPGGDGAAAPLSDAAPGGGRGLAQSGAHLRALANGRLRSG